VLLEAIFYNSRNEDASKKLASHTLLQRPDTNSLYVHLDGQTTLQFGPMNFFDRLFVGGGLVLPLDFVVHGLSAGDDDWVYTCDAFVELEAANGAFLSLPRFSASQSGGR
jgi:hypothetical protein